MSKANLTVVETVAPAEFELTAIAPIKLTLLDDGQYTAASELFKSEAVRNLTTDFYNYLYTAARNYIKSGDTNILNSLLDASRLVSRVRVVQECIAEFSFHAKGKNGLYAGKKLGKREDVRNEFSNTAHLKSVLVNILSENEALIATKKIEKAKFDLDKELKKLDQLIIKLVKEKVPAHIIAQHLTDNGVNGVIVEDTAKAA